MAACTLGVELTWLIQFIKVFKKYSGGIEALKNMTVEIKAGEFVFLVGPSGAGKSTFIKLLFREELPSEGHILVAGKNLVRFRRWEIPLYRRNIGMVFQDFRLLGSRNVWENVSFALEVQGCPREELREKVSRVLREVKLEQRAYAFPGQLSGGEQQRTAIARAMVNRPRILVADEPTGNLDQDTSWEIMDLLLDINKLGTTVVIATHNRDIVDYLQKRVLRLNQGALMADKEDGGYSS